MDKPKPHIVTARQYVDDLHALTLLSLDFVAPLFESLGVGVGNREALLDVLRPGLSQAFEWERTQVDQKRSSKFYEELYAVNLRPIITTIEDRLGDLAVRRLCFWQRYVYAQDSNPWGPYKLTLNTWGQQVRRLEPEQLEFTSIDARTIAEQFSIAVSIDDVADILETQSGKPLSAWDRPLFEQRGLLTVPSGSSFFPFVDTILVVVRMHRFQFFWAPILNGLSSQEKARIESAVRWSCKPELFSTILDLPIAP